MCRDVTTVMKSWETWQSHKTQYRFVIWISFVISAKRELHPSANCIHNALVYLPWLALVWRVPFVFGVPCPALSCVKVTSRPVSFFALFLFPFFFLADHSVLIWLDRIDPNKARYVCFGSLVTLRPYNILPQGLLHTTTCASVSGRIRVTRIPSDLISQMTKCI